MYYIITRIALTIIEQSDRQVVCFTDPFSLYLPHPSQEKPFFLTTRHIYPQLLSPKRKGISGVAVLGLERFRGIHTLISFLELY